MLTRRFPRVGRACFACLLVLSLPAEAQTLRYLGQQLVPYGYEFSGTTVGGLSGLDYDTTTNRFVAISDDRSERQPARFYTLKLDPAVFSDGDQAGFAGVRFLEMTTFKTVAGVTHAAGTVDPEAIRHAGDGGYWWASEGNARRDIAPAVEKVGADGTALHHVELPSHYLPGPDRGVRPNLAFESLALGDGRLIVGTENALMQDGPPADIEQPSPARLLVFDMASGRLIAEHVYPVVAVPLAPPLPGLYRTNGLVDLLAGEGMLLALERSYTMGIGNSIRIYRIELAGASDVARHATLAGEHYVPVRKKLLLDLGLLEVTLDNLEGLSWGPRLPNGRRSLVLVSDNNFSARQLTQFLLFELGYP